MRDTKTRSFVKGLVWRVAGVAILGALTWLFTKDWMIISSVTLIFHGIRIVLYYIHERMWERIHWGRIR